ncbi:symmetrical bis(5'-nucleosyl)-tetraphosphatase [Nitratifractor sp.]
MIWAIGDLQGCYDSFRLLLERIGFEPDRDTLWLAGDLVNRGPKSREVLEYLYSIRHSLRVVLGNHDIALLAAWWGIKKSNPTLDPILADPRVEEWIEWLRSQPFVQVDLDLGYVMAHAGIPPEFGLGSSLHYNRILTRRLRSERAPEWLRAMMDKNEDHFDPLGGDLQHERYMLAGFTRMRFCSRDGWLDFDQKGPPTPKVRAKGLMPWFECPVRKPVEEKILFGHWSTLGYFENDAVCCLDSGCLWRGKLTAKRLDTEDCTIVQVPCPEGIAPR